MSTAPFGFPVTPNDWVSLIFRLTIAVLAGGVIGWNRQLRGKAAGLRTHMLVSLGAALFVMVPLGLADTPSRQLEDATSRAIQGVATGIGFLGAGEILQTRRGPGDHQKIKGLTSAASIWVTAALGVAAGSGMWQLILVATLLSLFILIGAKWIEQFIPTQSHHED